MTASPAPVKAPPRPSTSQLKFQICQAIQGLTQGKVPAAWSLWDAERTARFLQDLQGCHTGRSLAGLVISAKAVAEAYGRNPREILPAEVFE